MTRVIVGNLATAVPGGPSERRIQEVLHLLEQEFDPDVWLLCETNKVRPAALLGKGSWDSHQGVTMGRDNNAVVWDRKLRATQQRFWIGTWPNGHTLEPRWINRARVTGIGWTIVHIPPERDQALVPGMLSRMSAHTYSQRLVWAGDKNAAKMRQWAEQHGYHYRETGVMFLASDLPILRYRDIRLAGFDHAFLIADIGRE